MVMVVPCIFHAFHDFLFHGIYIIHHGNNGHIGGIQGAQGILQPVFHGPAVADQHIGMLDRPDVGRGRLKRMTVHTCRNDHLKVHLVTSDLPHEIVIWKQGYRYF